MQIFGNSKAFEGSSFAFQALTGRYSSERFDGSLKGGSGNVIRSGFSNYAKLLTFLKDELLQVFSACRSYEFTILIFDERCLTTDFVTSLLRLPAIAQCPSVALTLSPTLGDQPVQLFELQPVQLPTSAIINWLHHVIKGKNDKKSLRIHYTSYFNRGEIDIRFPYADSFHPKFPSSTSNIGIKNTLEIVNHLKQVKILVNLNTQF